MGPIPLPLFGLNRTGLRESGLFSTHHYLIIWQRWRDGIEVTKYLTIIPRARMGSESKAHEAEGRMGY